MKKLTSLLLTILLVLLSARPALAGFGGNGVTPVPITETSIDKDALNIFDDSLAAWESGGMVGPKPDYPAFEDVPQARVDTLKMFSPFSGMTDEQVREKVRQMRRALVCVVDLIERDDRELAFALNTLMRNRKICFGLRKDGKKLARAAIFPDGKAEFGVEPINIFTEVCEDWTTSDYELFDLYNSLSHEALHGTQVIAKPTGSLNTEEARDVQAAEVAAHQGEVDRICAMLEVIQSIGSSNELPEDASGAALFFGANILALPPASRATVVDEWEMSLLREKPQAARIVSWRQVFVDLAQAQINGDTDFSSFKEKLEPYREWNEIYGNEREFGPIYAPYIYSIAPDVTGPPGSRTVSGGGMRQVKPPLFVPEPIVIAGIDVYADAAYWEETNEVYILGINFGTPDMAELWKFDVDPVNFTIVLGTEVKCLETTMLNRGADLFEDPHMPQPNLYALQRGTGDICVFEDTDMDDVPDAASFHGSVPQGAGAEMVDIEIIDLNLISARPVQTHTMPTWHQPLAFATRAAPGSPWVPNPQVSHWGHEYTTAPSVATLPYEDQDQLLCAGTPGLSFEIQFVPEGGGPPTVVGSGTFGWAGLDAPALSSPLSPTDNIRVVDSLGAQGPDITVAPPLDTRPGMTYEEWTNATYNSPGAGTHSNDHWGKAPVNSAPGRPVQRQTFNYHTKSWESEPAHHSNLWGQTYHNLPTPGAPSSPGRNWTRFTHPTLTPPTAGTSKTFTIPPCFPVNLSMADPGDPALLYEIVDPPTFIGSGDSLNPALFQSNEDGTFTITMLTFSGSVSFSYRTLYMFPYGVGGPISTITINVDTTALTDPEPYTGTGGVEYVDAPVLPYIGENFPLYQFLLANGPFDTCEDPHWHSPLVFNVYSFEDTLFGESDPDQFGCGYGELQILPPAIRTVTLADWISFKVLHPPPF